MSSKKYIIDKNQVLGEGGTAKVYVGMSTISGEFYALKCSRGNATFSKELSILQESNHNNILKFYEKLEDFSGFKSVLVLELCNKGSLLDMALLYKGVCDNLFLKTLECLCESLSYLRGKVYVHRDIKPDNLMVHEDPMGYYNVKIGDFATAKKVTDDQTFSTLVGTEEYLHPEMFERLTSRTGNDDRSHKANMDLWSIGVTLYHIVVTKLPYFSHKYSRKCPESRKVMTYLYENKPENAISGRQENENDFEIEWSYELPKDCRLSLMLKDIATDLIVSLMDRSDKNTYENFFETARKILQKKRALLFNTSNGELQFLYLDALTYNDIMEASNKLMGVKQENVRLFTRRIKLDQLHDQQVECCESYPIKGHVKYEITDSTILAVTLNQDDSADCKCPSIEMDLKAPEFKNCMKYAHKFNKKIMQNVYEMGRNSNYIDCQIACFKTTMDCIRKDIIINLKSQWQIEKNISMLDVYFTKLEEIKIFPNHEVIKKCRTNMNKLQNSSLGCVESYEKFLMNKEKELKIEFFCKLKQDYEESQTSLYEPLDHLVHLVENLYNKINDIFKFHTVIDEDYYRLEIWGRQNLQYSYSNLAAQSLKMKHKLLENIYLYYKDWMGRNATLVKMENMEFSACLDQLQSALENFIKETSDSLVKDHPIKDRIKKITTLVNRTKTAIM